MKLLLFDPFSGASGDMVIAGLVDIGADATKVRNAMELAADVDVNISRTFKRGISACSVRVLTRSNGSLTLQGIIDRIRSLDLSSDIVSDAISIFNILGNAESKVHDLPLEKLHFHEIGQEDAIADIIGACTAFNDLGSKNFRIYCSPISVGMGYVEFSHGRYPVPAPATLEILKEYSLPWQFGPVEAELLTPTGASILAHFISETGIVPPLKTERIGYGGGFKDLQVPNVLRVITGEADEALISDRIELLETNVDDVTGQVLGNLIDELLTAGAKDVTIIPATMKKGRSGHIIQVISKHHDSDKLSRKIIEETGSLGVRVLPVKHRLIAQRELSSVEVTIKGRIFSIPIKIARDLRGSLLNISAEFDDCKRAAKDSGIPVREIIRKAEEKARQIFS